ncbi:transposase [Anthocerotibacter panamensis]|uniref:transposase n=1 Tax=Anthocerotibacter panamensis TaxID=2857077 RepID=UPI001C401623|nr:transposase [Anthocerotibacter panamensis]
MKSVDVTDEQWAILQSLLPKQPQGPGRPRTDDRKTLNGILWVLKTGSSWQDMPDVYGSRITCWRRFKAWATDGTWDRVWRSLLGHMDHETKQDWTQAFLAGNFVPAKRGPVQWRKPRRPRTEEN